jgi:AcrR family transcriptional regulator
MILHSAKKARVQALRSKLKEVAAAAILDAAEEVFADEGLDARMEQIAAHAGVSVGTLYNHFADRDQLLRTLVESRRASVYALVEKALLESEHLSFRDHLVLIIESVCDVTGARARLRRRIMETGLAGAKVREREVAGFVREALEPLFAKARKAGELKADPHQLQVAMFVGLLLPVLNIVLDKAAPTPLRKVAEVVVDNFLHGVAVSPGTAYDPRQS